MILYSQTLAYRAISIGKIERKKAAVRMKYQENLIYQAWQKADAKDRKFQ